jgi:hypothetical protein
MRKVEMSKKRLSAALVLGAFVCGVTACGGGGGNREPAAPPTSQIAITEDYSGTGNYDVSYHVNELKLVGVTPSAVRCYLNEIQEDVCPDGMACIANGAQRTREFVTIVFDVLASEIELVRDVGSWPFDGKLPYLKSQLACSLPAN